MSGPDSVMHVFDKGSGRPLIFLHGWASHGGYFAPQVEALTRDFRLVIPDLPGHRRSWAPLNELSIARLATGLRSLIVEHRLDKPILIGWSMGAMVAFDYIAQFGTERIGGLVIEDMTVKITNEPGWRFGIRNGFDTAQSAAAVTAMREDWACYSQNAMPRLFARGRIPDAQLGSWVAAEIARNDGLAMAALWQSMAEQDYRPLLPQLALPVLVLHGGESQLYESAVGQWMAANIAGARRCCFDNAGHSPHLEVPAAYNRALTDFITSL
ncbi:MAG: alpha/beta hydrolase [Ferrovibrio sp.]|uniref:alpha/beta fold hydrolase n=1 Tax=Ferrovibrio sp. TaxID=1917215 RepID=UPI00262A0B88|nr:alpha/beta hydrolase [Ferrovibrio sp.]MCW0235331.1 alpha/beta hydrolase [Ferrovibrio sp.]